MNFILLFNTGVDFSLRNNFTDSFAQVSVPVHIYSSLLKPSILLTHDSALNYKHIVQFNLIVHLTELTPWCVHESPASAVIMIFPQEIDYFMERLLNHTLCSSNISERERNVTFEQKLKHKWKELDYLSPAVRAFVQFTVKLLLGNKFNVVIQYRR